MINIWYFLTCGIQHMISGHMLYDLSTDMTEGPKMRAHNS